MRRVQLRDGELRGAPYYVVRWAPVVFAPACWAVIMGILGAIRRGQPVSGGLLPGLWIVSPIVWAALLILSWLIARVVFPSKNRAVQIVALAVSFLLAFLGHFVMIGMAVPASTGTWIVVTVASLAPASAVLIECLEVSGKGTDRSKSRMPRAMADAS